MTQLTENKYITTATASVGLFYPRSVMVAGQKINNYKVNAQLINGLKECDTVIFSMYWKPIGDSLLFLSVVQACYEYLSLVRPQRMPEFLLDDKFSSLIKHIFILKNAKVIKNGVDWFKEAARNEKKVALLTDDDPFKQGKSVAVFNSEEYIYPKFYESFQDKVKEYPSRPARYFLTFERQVGLVLSSNPNDSLPDFIMDNDEKLRSICLTKFKVDPDDSKFKYIGVVSQAGLVEKKFGADKYLNVINKLVKDPTKVKILFLANSKEESPRDWLKMKKKAEKSPCEVIFLDSSNLELLAYIFARCRLVLGNDTGFSHLAAMSRKSTKAPRVPCVIIYSRHDYGKWNTGKDNVYPVVTKLSEYLRENNTSISRDKIDVTSWGLAEWAYSIPESRVVNTAKKLWTS